MSNKMRGHVWKAAVALQVLGIAALSIGFAAKAPAVEVLTSWGMSCSCPCDNVGYGCVLAPAKPSTGGECPTTGCECYLGGCIPRSGQ